MNLSRAVGCLVGGLVIGCGADPNDPVHGLLQQPIVRGEVEEGLPQVVLLHVEGASGLTRCSGTYVAKRVVLTAAHCVRADGAPSGFFVYHGDDYAADVAQLPNIPPPGEPSVWARAETLLVHPDYDPALNYPDLAIAYLDRELPFEPLELLSERIGRHDLGRKATIVGWGANSVVSADPFVVAGEGVKRSGPMRMQGSPTLADFHPEDPNPGILDPNIRRDLLKLDGRAPNANICAGDSGGPILLPRSSGWGKHGRHSRPQVAGVTFWGGLLCEDYTMATRIDPFERFFRDAFRDAGSRRIVPQLECVTETGTGDLRAYFGYNNQNALTIDIPHSRRNFFPADVENERPESFAPGEQPWQFSVDFEPRDRLFYEINPPEAPASALLVNRRGPRCEADDPEFICARQCEASLAAECPDQTVGFGRCVTDCMEFRTFFPGCDAPANGYFNCIAALTPDASNWLCLEDFIPQPASPLCEAEFFELLICAGF